MARGAFRWLLTVAAAGALLAATASAEQQTQDAFQPKDEQPEDFPEGPGRDETFYACTACHGFRIVAQQGMTRRQWDESLNWMTERHGMPELEGDERKIVLDYLEATFAPRQPAARGGWQNPFLKR